METRPGRGLHGAYLSAVHSRRERRLVRVSYRGEWILRYRTGTLPAHMHQSAAQMEAKTLDYFCWNHTPQPGETVVDVGAGVGTEALTFSRLVGSTGRVIALEAHPDAYVVLRQIIELNGLTNVTAVQVALADQPGTISISTVSDNIDSHSVVNRADDSAGDHVVPATTLGKSVV